MPVNCRSTFAVCRARSAVEVSNFLRRLQGGDETEDGQETGTCGGDGAGGTFERCRLAG